MSKTELIQAVMRWISRIPQSLVRTTDPSEFFTTANIVQMLRMTLDPQFKHAASLPQLKLELVAQISARNLHSKYSKFSDIISVIPFDNEHLFRKLNSLFMFSVLVFKIGICGFNSDAALATFNLLGPGARSELQQYLYSDALFAADGPGSSRPNSQASSRPNSTDQGLVSTQLLQLKHENKLLNQDIHYLTAQLNKLVTGGSRAPNAAIAAPQNAKHTHQDAELLAFESNLISEWVQQKLRVDVGC